MHRARPVIWSWLSDSLKIYFLLVDYMQMLNWYSKPESVGFFSAANPSDLTALHHHKWNKWLSEAESSRHPRSWSLWTLRAAAQIPLPFCICPPRCFALPCTQRKKKEKQFKKNHTHIRGKASDLNFFASINHMFCMTFDASSVGALKVWE